MNVVLYISAQREQEQQNTWRGIEVVITRRS